MVLAVSTRSDPPAVTGDVEAYLGALVDSSPAATLLFDADRHVVHANRAARLLSGKLNPEPGCIFTRISDWHRDLIPAEALSGCVASGSWSGTISLALEGGLTKHFQLHLVALGNDRAAPYCAWLHDITAERARQAELQQRNAHLADVNTTLQGFQDQVVQSEKLASIGQLAAGVAHEINNPIGFVNSNLDTLQRYVARLLAAIRAQNEVIAGTGDHSACESAAAIHKQFKLDFLEADIQDLLNESLEGINRVCSIVRNLKEFSRTTRPQDWTKADLHAGLDTTLGLVWHELKYKAQIVKTYGELPQIECLPSELNQVFMNVLLNASQAIGEPGVITITTGCDAHTVWIAIGDDGRGMTPEVLAQAFEPFFTTKPCGSGTGLGLATCKNIVQKHQGSIDISSAPDQGTMVRIELPIEQRR